jgi:hypothetical protein
VLAKKHKFLEEQQSGIAWKRKQLFNEIYHEEI